MSATLKLFSFALAFLAVMLTADWVSSLSSTEIDKTYDKALQACKMERSAKYDESKQEALKKLASEGFEGSVGSYTKADVAKYYKEGRDAKHSETKGDTEATEKQYEDMVCMTMQITDPNQDGKSTLEERKKYIVVMFLLWNEFMEIEKIYFAPKEH